MIPCFQERFAQGPVYLNPFTNEEVFVPPDGDPFQIVCFLKKK